MKKNILYLVLMTLAFLISFYQSIVTEFKVFYLPSALSFFFAIIFTIRTIIIDLKKKEQ